MNDVYRCQNGGGNGDREMTQRNAVRREMITDARATSGKECEHACMENAAGESSDY